MVAEAKPQSAVERIIKYFLQQEHNSHIYYGYNRGAPRAQIVIFKVAGMDEDTTIQHDVWGVDKESTLQTTLDLVSLYEDVASYSTPYGTLVGANPTNYTWRPDEEYARYVLDVRTHTTV